MTLMSSSLLLAAAGIGSGPPIPAWAWVAFVAGVGFLLALDLGVFHKADKSVSFKVALAWCGVWGALAAAFGFFIGWWRGPEEVDFRLRLPAGTRAERGQPLCHPRRLRLLPNPPKRLRHRVLFWGVLGAAVARRSFVAGVALVSKFSWLMVVFGAVLLFTGAKMALPAGPEEKDLTRNPVVRLAKRLFPVTSRLRAKAHFVH